MASVCKNVLTKLGIEQVKHEQAEIMLKLCRGVNVLACLRTGFGKSLLFQLPALTSSSLTVVVSPLIATIDDQTTSLNRKMGYEAALGWHSGKSHSEKEHLWRQLSRANLFYCSPEALVSGDLLKELTLRRKVNRVVIDETHLAYTWGRQFRVAYRDLRASVEKFVGDCNWLAITATANNDSLNGIMDVIGSDFETYLSSPISANMTYRRESVKNHQPLTIPLKMLPGLTRHQIQYLKDTATLGGPIPSLLSIPQKTLIFCTSKRRACLLHSLIPGFEPFLYHGGMSAEERHHVVKQFSQVEKGVMICTSAFGVGVDIPGIERVIHTEMPLNIDAFMQETGRAGRGGYSGCNAESIYLHHPTISSQSACQLLQFSYPKAEQVQLVFEYFEAGCELMFESRNVASYPLSVSHMIDILEISESIINKSISILTKENCITLDEEVGEYSVVVNKPFDVESYRSQRDAVFSEYYEMKKYGSILEPETEFLKAHYAHNAKRLLEIR